MTISERQTPIEGPMSKFVAVETSYSFSRLESMNEGNGDDGDDDDYGDQHDTCRAGGSKKNDDDDAGGEAKTKANDHQIANKTSATISRNNISSRARRHLLPLDQTSYDQQAGEAAAAARGLDYLRSQPETSRKSVALST